MTFGSRITNVKIWGAPDFWEAVPGELPNGAADPAQYRSLILTTLERIYDQGGGSSMIDEAISRGGGFLRIGNEMTFGNRFVNEPGYVPYILISTEFTEATYFFNDRGKLVQNKFELALAHEVAHAAGHRDPSDGERPPDVEANAADYDYRGGAVDFQNSVALTLNLPGT